MPAPCPARASASTAQAVSRGLLSNPGPPPKPRSLFRRRRSRLICAEASRPAAIDAIAWRARYSVLLSDSDAMASARLDGRVASAASACAVSLRSCNAVATEEASLARLPSAWTWLCSHDRPRETSGERAWARAVAAYSGPNTHTKTSANSRKRADHCGSTRLSLPVRWIRFSSRFEREDDRPKDYSRKKFSDTRQSLTGNP